MFRYVPIAFGVLLIIGLTTVQVMMTDRLSGTNVTAQQRAELLKKIPMNIGDWHGTDLPIDEAVRKTAGAVGAVSRQYHNVRTNDVVDLWLIVGHGRAISAHTPDICYPSSGFASRVRENSVYPMELDDGYTVPFLTNTFVREDVTGRRLVRVFWTWYNTESESREVVWEAPTNARWYFGNTRALYKMYFTSQMRDQMETSEQSPCEQFAEDFFPVVNEALSQVYNRDGEPGDLATPDATASDSTTPETITPDAEAPAAATSDDSTLFDAPAAEVAPKADVEPPASVEPPAVEK